MSKLSKISLTPIGIKAFAERAFKENNLGQAQKLLQESIERGDPDLITYCRTIVGKLSLQYDTIDLPDAEKAVFYEERFNRLHSLFRLTIFDMRSHLRRASLAQGILRMRCQIRPNDDIENYLKQTEGDIGKMAEMLDESNLSMFELWLDDASENEQDA